MKAFLSHSSADNALAKKIYRWLRDQAVSVWFDRIELRPGDSLMAKIAAGITDADILLVLVTENSKNSPWVEKEVSIALTQEVAGTGPKVVPLLLKNCEIPTMLADKIYVSIDEEGSGVAEIIPAIFRDSYILDIIPRAENLELDLPSLRDDLHEYYRSDFSRIRVRIANRDVNAKVTEIAERTASTGDTPAPVIDQIKRKSDLFPIQLPIYWTNLSDLLARLASEVFAHFGKNLDALQVAVKAIDKTFQYSHYVMSSHLQWAIFPSYAEQFGFPDIAGYVRRYEGYDEEKLVREICELRPDDHLTFVGLVGSKRRKVIDRKLYLPRVSDTDRIALQLTCSVAEIITDYSWYIYCLPQILGEFLSWTAFREGKPPHELEYVVGLKMDDYDRIGLA